MKILRHTILTLMIGLPLSTLPLPGQSSYDWTGEGDNGDWSNSDNWDPFPNFNEDNPIQNQYIFIFDTPQQTNQNMGNNARFQELRFDAGNFTLEASNQILFGHQDGGITVDSGNIILRSASVAMSPFRSGSTGGFKVNNGSLLLDVTGNIAIGASSQTRYLLADGNGTITINGTLVDSGVGGGIRLKTGFSGRLTLNTGGSTIGTTTGGEVFHAGTGILELGANDALGNLPLEFRNLQAGIEAGGQSRSIANAVLVNDGFRVTGSHALRFGGSVNLGTTSATIKIEEGDGELVFAGEVTGSGGTLTETGAGRLSIEFNQATTWSQSVQINEGQLHVSNGNGLATGTGLLTIGADGVLSGTGRVGETEIAGTLRLEDAQGLSFAGDLSLQTTSTVVMNHGAGAILLEGDLDLAAGVTLSLEGDGWNVGQTYRLFNLEDGSITGELSFSGPYVATFSYQNGTEGYVGFSLAAIPEPSSLLLGAIAFTLAAATLRRRKSSATTTVPFTR